MPFQKLNTHTTNKKKKLIQIKRKEEDSLKTHKTSFSSLEWRERAYAFTSLKGSLVVEASLVIPVFFLAACCLCFLLEVASIQNNIEMAAHYACKTMMQDCNGTFYINKSKLEQDMIEAIGKSRVDDSMIEGGSAGIHCDGTKMLYGTGIVDFHVNYKIRIPVFTFGKFALSCEKRWKVKKWTGYKKEGFVSDENQIVYVTENGMVYHKNINCPYLNLSIKMVPRSEVELLRNKDGEIYYPCSCCKNNNSKYVYITSFGSRYHASVGCSGLKRKIYAIPISQTRGKGVCSKCGK